MSPKTPETSAPMPAADTPREPKQSLQPELAVVEKRIRNNKRGKNKGGRPSKMNPKTVAKLEEAFENDFTLEEAWDHAGISKATYYRHLDANDGFRDRMRRAQTFPLTLAKKTVLAQIKGSKDKPGDGSLGLRLLERRQPERYRTKVETDLPPPIPPMTIILPGAVGHPRFTPMPPVDVPTE